MMKKKPKLVYIEWADAVANAIWMLDSEAENWADKGSDWIVKECGFIVKETKEYICLAGRYKPEDNNTDAQFGNLQKIPKTWILKRKTINV